LRRAGGDSRVTVTRGPQKVEGKIVLRCEGLHGFVGLVRKRRDQLHFVVDVIDEQDEDGGRLRGWNRGQRRGGEEHDLIVTGWRGQ
jgi:hypothetical protein